MSRADEFYTAGLRYHFTPGGRQPDTSLRPHVLKAYDSNGIAGRIEWDHREDNHGGTVGNIFTERNVRRRGVASALWAQAHNQGVNPPKHSSFQTPMGKAWSTGMANRERGVKRRGTTRKPGADQESMF